MSLMRKIAIAALVLGALLVGFGIWYKYEYSMSLAQAYELNTLTSPQKLLIATQGSTFKDRVTEGITNHYKSDSLYMKVIDISDLSATKPSDFNAIVILHTWENWQAPEEVQGFISRTKAFENRIIVLSTSGDGSYKMEGIDAIACESNLDDAEKYINQIIERVDHILNL